MEVLIVEDDDAIADALTTGLNRLGYTVRRVSTASDALTAPEPDLVLLDLGLPDLDGQEVCRRIRERSQVPLIVITARSDEIDRVMLLDLGADDYVVKPFGFRELAARIRAVLRRVRANPVSETQRLGGMELDRRRRRVLVEGREVQLTPKEFDLLAFLAEDPGAVFTRDEIIRSVWDEHWWGSTKTLDVHVASLRRKLGDRELIETVRGVGYRLAAGGEVPR